MAPTMFANLLYRLHDEAGELLYIGRTNDLRRRMTRHAEVQPWWREVFRSTVETLPDLDALKAAEKAAILAERPKYNIVYNGRVLIVPEDVLPPAWLMVSSRVTAAADVLHRTCRVNKEGNYPEEGVDDSPPCDGCTQEAVDIVRAIDAAVGADEDPALDRISAMLTEARSMAYSMAAEGRPFPAIVNAVKAHADDD